MVIQTDKTYETGQETKVRLANEIEQDRIAKAIKPKVAKYHNPVRKLPKPLRDMICWMAREPTPTAKIMKDVSITCRVFPHSDHSPFGPGKKCVIHVQLPYKKDATFRDSDLPSFVRRCEKTFAIRDIPLDAEPESCWRSHDDR